MFKIFWKTERNEVQAIAEAVSFVGGHSWIIPASDDHGPDDIYGYYIFFSKKKFSREDAFLLLKGKWPQVFKSEVKAERMFRAMYLP